jgi:hypothetical protein
LALIGWPFCWPRESCFELHSHDFSALAKNGTVILMDFLNFESEIRSTSQRWLAVVPWRRQRFSRFLSRRPDRIQRRCRRPSFCLNLSLFGFENSKDFEARLNRVNECEAAKE